MIMHTSETRRMFEKEALVHLDSVYNFALRLTYNEQDAEDLVQETYFKAFRFFDQFSIGSDGKAWLFTILKNTFINKYRKKSRGLQEVDYDSVQDFIGLLSESDGKTEEDHVDIYRHSLNDELEDALLKLPIDFRMVILMCDIEGFSYQEIADILNTPIGTIRSRLSRARKKMRQLLAKTDRYADRVYDEYPEEAAMN